MSAACLGGGEPGAGGGCGGAEPLGASCTGIATQVAAFTGRQAGGRWLLASSGIHANGVSAQTGRVPAAGLSDRRW